MDCSFFGVKQIFSSLLCGVENVGGLFHFFSLSIIYYFCTFSSCILIEFSKCVDMSSGSSGVGFLFLAISIDFLNFIFFSCLFYFYLALPHYFEHCISTSEYVNIDKMLKKNVLKSYKIILQRVKSNNWLFRKLICIYGCNGFLWNKQKNKKYQKSFKRNDIEKMLFHYFFDSWIDLFFMSKNRKLKKISFL